MFRVFPALHPALAGVATKHHQNRQVFLMLRLVGWIVRYLTAQDPFQRARPPRQHKIEPDVR